MHGSPEGTDEHHREIWSDAIREVRDERPPVYYVENHNAGSGYSEAALDFQLLVEELLPRLGPGQWGNWTGPVLHLARQTLELRLKALLDEIVHRDQATDPSPLGRHDLSRIWWLTRGWLSDNGYPLLEDARLDATDMLIKAFHAVDPNGDLFRFAQSRQVRFGRKKTYDRVGVNQRTFAPAFRQAVALLRHWEAVICRERLCQEMGWVADPFFDASDFPRAHAAGGGNHSA